MHMLSMKTSGLSRKMGDAVRLIDYTACIWRAWEASGRAFPQGFGITRIMIDLGCDLPHRHRGQDQRIVAAKAMPIEAGETTSTIWVIMTTLGGLG